MVAQLHRSKSCSALDRMDSPARPFSPVPAQMRAATSSPPDLIEERLSSIERKLSRGMADIQTRLVNNAAEIKAKLDEKDKVDLERIREAQESWSRFIFRRCIDSFVSIIMRNLPLIVSLVLPIEIAATAGGGPVGLAIVTAPLVAVALGILLYQGYLAYKEYRQLRDIDLDDSAGHDGNNPQSPSAQTETQPPPVPGPTAPPAPEAPRGGWRSNCVRFARFMARRGIR